MIDFFQVRLVNDINNQQHFVLVYAELAAPNSCDRIASEYKSRSIVIRQTRLHTRIPGRNVDDRRDLHVFVAVNAMFHVPYSCIHYSFTVLLFIHTLRMNIK